MTERVKLRTSNLARVYANKSPLKTEEKRECERIQGLPNFFDYPILSQERVKLRTSNLAGIFTGSMRQKPLKNGQKRERGRIQGQTTFFWVPAIISGTGTATNFNFGRCIHSVHGNKIPLKLWEKWERGRIQPIPGTGQIFSVPPIVSGTGTNFQLCTHILSIDRNKSPLQIWGKVAVC